MNKIYQYENTDTYLEVFNKALNHYLESSKKNLNPLEVYDLEYIIYDLKCKMENLKTLDISN